MTMNFMMILQHDWDDVLWKLDGEVWVAYKVKGEETVYGKLRCTHVVGGLPKLTGSNGFSVENISRDYIMVKYKDGQHTTVFISATKVYSGIHKKGITSLCVSPKGLSVSACTDNQLLIWDFNQGELKCTLSGHVGEVYKCKFFPSGEVVMSAGADMKLRIWCALTGKCPVTLSGHHMAVTDFDFIDKGKNIISVSKDGVVKLWCCSTSSCLVDIAKFSSAINCCEVFTAPPSLALGEPPSPQGEDEVGTKDKLVILGCEDGDVHCVAVNSRKKLFSLAFNSPVNTLTSLNAFHCVVGCQSGEIFLIDITNTSKPVKVWFESNSAVLSVVRFKEDGFFSSHADGLVFYRHIYKENIRVVLTGPNCDPVYGLCTDQQFLYTCCRDALIRRYTVQRIINSLV